MTNKEARLKLQVLYGCRCLMTEKNSELTYHHLEKVEHGGVATVSNGAVLTNEAHQWLHSLEYTDVELYELVNECLRLYKKCLDLNQEHLAEQYEEECVKEFRKKLMR